MAGREGRRQTDRQAGRERQRGREILGSCLFLQSVPANLQRETERQTERDREREEALRF